MKLNIKLVLFDVDDTLIYTIDTAYIKTNQAGKEVFDKSITKEEFMKLYGKYNFEECIKMWYSTNEIDEFINVYKNIDIKYEFITNLDKLINYFKEKKILIGIVTNSTLEKTEKKLGKYYGKFDMVYANAEKPYPKVINLIKDKYQLNDGEIVLIGDSENDKMVCYNSNIMFYGVNTGKEKWNDKKVKYFESVNDIVNER